MNKIYRFLKKGEIINGSDEFPPNAYFLDWTSCAEHGCWIGEHYNENKHRVLRREVKNNHKYKKMWKYMKNKHGNKFVDQRILIESLMEEVERKHK